MPKEQEFIPAMAYFKGYAREQAKQSIGDGWHPLIDMLYDKLSTLQFPPPITQVKEKFGGLRVYYSYSFDNPSFDDFVMELERKSYTICETCGTRGALRSGAWMQTLCDTHAGDRPIVEPF